MKRNGISPASFLGLLLMAAALLLCLQNLREDKRAGEVAGRAAAALETGAAKERLAEPTVSEEVREMPVITIDGREYIGTLEIPALKLKLAVLAECTPEGLKTAPGRFSGSVYTDDLVIGAHNYASHFGRIGTLAQGESVLFTDGEGRCHGFRVEKTELLEPDAVEEMTQSSWDLSLFTCTPGGGQRLTVRCMNMRIESPSNPGGNCE